MTSKFNINELKAWAKKQLMKLKGAKVKLKNINYMYIYKKYKIRILVLIILIIVATSLLKNIIIKIKGKEQEAIPVKVMKVELINLYLSLDYIGNIKGQDEVAVYPKVSGKIIEKVKEDGAPIDKGEVIAYIDRDEVGLKFEKAPVESPITGTVGRVYVDIGSSVTPQSPVALVVNMDRVKIGLDIPEQHLPKVLLDQKAKIFVDAYPREEFIGKVTKLSPVLDLETRSAPVEISIDNQDHRLKSGMFAKVNLIIEEHKDVPAVLKEAITGREPNLYVFVAENNRALLKKVTLGIRQGPYFEVAEGLKAGDLVVIMGQQRLRDNMPVTIEIEQQDYSQQ